MKAKGLKIIMSAVLLVIVAIAFAAPYAWQRYLDRESRLPERLRYTRFILADLQTIVSLEGLDPFTGMGVDRIDLDSTSGTLQLYISTGPDRDFDYKNARDLRSVLYDPSNGIVSNGDVYLLEYLPN